MTTTESIWYEARSFDGLVVLYTTGSSTPGSVYGSVEETRAAIDYTNDIRAARNEGQQRYMICKVTYRKWYSDGLFDHSALLVKAIEKYPIWKE